MLIASSGKAADLFRTKTTSGSFGRVFALTNVTDFRTLASRGVKDAQLDRAEFKVL